MDLSDTEKKFYEDCFTDNFRVDGRVNDQLRPVHIKYGSIPAAWGSATIIYGDDEQEISVSIKGKWNVYFFIYALWLSIELYDSNLYAFALSINDYNINSLLTI